MTPTSSEGKIRLPRIFTNVFCYDVNLSKHIQMSSKNSHFLLIFIGTGQRILIISKESGEYFLAAGIREWRIVW